MFEPQPSPNEAVNSRNLSESGRDLVSVGAEHRIGDITNALSNAVNAIIYQFPDLQSRPTPVVQEQPVPTQDQPAQVVPMRPEYQAYTQPAAPVEHSYNDGSMLEGGLEYAQATLDVNEAYAAPIDHSTQPVAPVEPRQFSDEQYEAAREQRVDAQLANMYGNDGANAGNVTSLDARRAQVDAIYGEMGGQTANDSQREAEVVQLQQMRERYYGMQAGAQGEAA
jgi:hypothetical protein